jgi:hypothetical protein
MAKCSISVRNAALDARFAALGASPILAIFSGPEPTDIIAPDQGVKLAEMVLPTPYMLAASGGLKQKTGTWQDLLSNATGNPGYYRLYNATRTTCHFQGPCGVGSGELQCSAPFVLNTPVSVIAFNVFEGNA